MRNLSLSLLLFVTAAALSAQEYRYDVGASLGTVGYLGDANPTIPFAAPGASLQIVGRYNMNLSMAFSGTLGYYLLRGSTKRHPEQFPSGQAISFHSSAILFQPRFEYNFYPYSDKFHFLSTRRLVPFLSLGLPLGIAFTKRSPAFLPGVAASFGLKYKMANRWNLLLEVQGMHFFSDRLDTPTAESDFLNNPYRLSALPWKGGDGIIAVVVAVTYEFGYIKAQCNNL